MIGERCGSFRATRLCAHRALPSSCPYTAFGRAIGIVSFVALEVEPFPSVVSDSTYSHSLTPALLPQQTQMGVRSAPPIALL